MHTVGRSSLEAIIAAITRERAHQDQKWGTIAESPHEIATWLVIMQEPLNQAFGAWTEGDSREALRQVLQSVAVGVACLQQYGVYERDSAPAVIGGDHV